MINLSNAKVGDEYLTNNKFKLSVFAVAIENVCMIHEDKSGFMVFDKKDGTQCGHDGEIGQRIVSKIDSRTWLKDMPDAGIFKDDQWIACGEFGVLILFSEEPHLELNWWCIRGSEHCTQAQFMQLSMAPKLMAKNWKDSKISIEELREWQEANK